MKTFFALLISGCLLFGTSCVIVPASSKDNGKHKGWYKNRNNPHHPQSTNPGHSKKKLHDAE